jgi:drug/metabolite transporter (DMT)-like permease
MSVFTAFLIYFILSPIAPLQRRWLSKRNEGGDKIDLSFKVSLVAALLVSFLPLFSPFKLHGSAVIIITLLILSVAGGIGFYVLYFMSQRYVEAGVTAVLGNIYTPITIILSTLFLGESITGLQIIGTILLIISALIVSKKHRIGKVSFDKHFWMMLGSGVFLSVLLVANRQLMKITGFTASTVLSWWGLAIALGMLSLLNKSKTTYTNTELLVTGGLKFCQDLLWAVLTLLVANLSLVSAITTFKIVIMFIAAAVFLKEREDLKLKIFGSVLAVVGLMLMK